jgi:threonine dehydratase
MIFSSGIPVTVVMPVTAPIMKVENCKKLGATVVTYGDNFGEAKKRALQIADRKKMMYVNG